MASVVSDKDGIFELSHVPFGKYNLRVSSSDNESKTVEAIEISEQIANVKLEQIHIGKVNVSQLDEITIVCERLKGEEQIDRTVYAINDDIRKIATTGLDMLRNIPSVTVDFLNNVMLEGRSDIQFYVDGIKRNKEYVMQLDPQWIDKVELITNPSVKYDPDISGVISIILKKQGRIGVNGAFTIPLTNPHKGIAQPAANIEYGSDRYRVYAGAFMNYEGFNRKQNMESEWYDQGAGSKIFNKESTGKVKWIYSYINYGADWFINDRTSLNFLGEWSSWKERSRDNIIENRSYLNNALVQYYKTYMETDGGSDNYYYSLFLRRELAQQGCELKAEIYYNRTSGGLNNEYIDDYYNINNPGVKTTTIIRREDIDDTADTTQLKVDYSFLIKNVKNEIGTRTFFGWKKSLFENDNSDTDSSETLSDDFEYNQWRQAAYYNALGQFKAFKWQLGLTGEYSAIDINGTSDVSSFFLTPQASLQRDFDGAGNLKLSFQRRIERPQVYQVDPYERYVDSMHVRTGNPDLEPAAENSLELVYSKNFKSNFLAPKFYLEYTNNAIEDVTTIRDDGVSVTTWDNIGKRLEYGLGVNASFKINPHWQLNGDAAIFNREISSGLGPDRGNNQQKISWRFNATNVFTFPRDYSLSFISQYGSPSISYYREDYRDLLFLVAMGKKFSNKAEMNILYVPFIEDFTYSKSIIRYPGYREENAGSLDARNLFFIEFKYHFNYGKQVKKIERAIEYEKGQSGGGI
jgi:hypothetical protein